MAHVIQIPVEFTFEVEAAVWRIGTAKLAGWSRGIIGGPVLEIIEPAQYRGFRRSVSDKSLPQLSEEMRAYVERHSLWPIWSPSSDEEAESLTYEIGLNFGHHRIELLLCDHPGKKLGAMRSHLATMGHMSAKKGIDAWELRDEFLRVKRNTDDLARFLNKWGSWSGENGLSRPGLSSDKPRGPSFVFADSIWSDQDAFREAPLDPDWLRDRPLADFEARHKFPHFVRRVSTCRDAIEATIIFDFVQGLKFRRCTLKDCAIPFKLKSGHKRKYCSQYHAHLASIRRNRKLAAKLKAPTTRH